MYKKRSPTFATSREKTGGLVVLTLLLAGCATTSPIANAPAVNRFGWLNDLAGACWHQDDFGADVCYWLSDSSELYWLSRNHGELLGCGKYTIETSRSAKGSILAWDSDSVESVVRFTLGANMLVTDEDAEHPRGTTQRISRDRFSIQDRPGAPVLKLTRKGSLTRADAAIAQCLKWEAQRD